MLAKERQKKIMEMIRKNGAVTVSQLIEIFDVSLETVRRDLLSMEQKGQLSRVHGGAVQKGEMKPFSELRQRNQEYNREKRELSLKAAEVIADGDVIAVDSGSTAILFAEVLKEKFSSLTVVTNSHDVFEILCNHADFSVILCAGHYLRRENAFYGSLAIEMLKKLHCQKAFIFPSAISLEFGICDYQKEMYDVQKQMLSMAEEIFVLADSSKFEKKALLKLEDMKHEYCYITDSNLSEELKILYQENNIRVLTGGKQK